MGLPRYVLVVGTAVQLHLCDERSEEPFANSTDLYVVPRPCGGALLITQPGGKRRLIPAHRGSRDCTDADCRRRYRSRVFALALNGMREEAARGIEWAKLLTLTLPSVVTVPEEWIIFGPHWREGKKAESGRTMTVPPSSPQAYRYMAERFNAFQTAARRKWSYSYFRVVEQGSDGVYRDDRGYTRLSTARVHYHLLVMCRHVMSQATISKLALGAGLGVIADIRAVRVTRRPRNTEVEPRDEKLAKLAGYLASYTAKTGGAAVPYRMRFFVMSRGWAGAYRASVERRKAERAAQRAASGVSVEYVREGDIAELLACGLDIADLRPVRGPERAQIPLPRSRPKDSPRRQREAAA